MDKDAANLKKWLVSVGMDINDISDEMVKKLIPPQRRDMWRHIIKHVRPKEEVDLIKKSILLHNIQKLQQPLMAKVENEGDLVRALFYQDLSNQYIKIQKEIAEIKLKNEIMQTEVNEKNLDKEKLKRENQYSRNKSYLAQKKTGYYFKFYKIIRELSELCNHFSQEANTDLTKSDYEDSLIRCFAVVDLAKQHGQMNDSVNLGKNLCNVFYSTIKDKSPTMLLETIKENLKTHISEGYDVLNAFQRIDDYDYADREVLFKEFYLKLMRKQLELKTIHSASVAEKDRLAKQLVETARTIKNDIISRFELQNISRSPEQLRMLRINISEAFEIVIKNCLDCSKIVGWPEKFNVEETFRKLDEIFAKTTKLNDKIEHKRLLACEMLKELNEKKNDFGVAEINTVMEKITEDYSTKIIEIDEMETLIHFMKHVAFMDVDNIHKPITKLDIKPEAHRFRTLEEIADHIQSVDVFGRIRKKFEEFNNFICAENKFLEIEQKESVHKAEFEALISQMKTQLSVLNGSVEDCMLVSDVVTKKKPGI